jgi:hypothetical protein
LRRAALHRVIDQEQIEPRQEVRPTEARVSCSFCYPSPGAPARRASLPGAVKPAKDRIERLEQIGTN